MKALSKEMLATLRELARGPRPTSLIGLRGHALVKRGLARRDPQTWDGVVVPSSFEFALTTKGMRVLEAEREPRKLYTFVGECRSLTAIRKGWTWADGRLAAKPLFEALEAMQVDLASVDFMNLWKDPRRGKPDERVIDESRLDTLVSLIGGRIIVALGARVSTELIARKIDHVALIHPAARGRIRKRSRYIAHVKERLS
jgi:hypothetical protein